MSRPATSFVLGYHGCSEAIGRRIVTEGLLLEPSNRDYDWLGPGTYFWESDRRRAVEWARDKVARGEYARPFVIGAVIDLGNCLDLTVRNDIELLADAYRGLARLRRAAGLPIPRNGDIRSSARGDKVLRYRDCAVIRHLHGVIDDPAANPPGEGHVEPFDTVRGLFVEGSRAYPGGGFYTKTHTQIAVRTDACIREVFVPRS